MKRMTAIVIFFLTILFFLSNPLSSCTEIEKAISEAIAELGLERGDRRMAVLTNLGYVETKGISMLELGKILERTTGCRQWEGNLLFFHSRQERPLRIAILRKDKGDLACISCEGGILKMVKTNISIDRIVDKNGISEVQKVLGADTFSIVSILLAWSFGAPYPLLKAGELHNHICPGLIHGYMIANFIKEKYPLTEGQSYVFISSPPWCKDDTIQTILDLTPGKRTLFVMGLAEEQKSKLLDKDVAGILIIRQKEKKEMKGAVIRFDTQKLHLSLGAQIDEKNPLESRLKLVSLLIPNLGKHNEFVSVAKEFDLDQSMLQRITQAGKNPYSEIGFEGR